MSAETTAAGDTVQNKMLTDDIVREEKHGENLNKDLANDFQGNSVSQDIEP